MLCLKGLSIEIMLPPVDGHRPNRPPAIKRPSYQTCVIAFPTIVGTSMLLRNTLKLLRPRIVFCIIDQQLITVTVMVAKAA